MEFKINIIVVLLESAAKYSRALFDSTENSYLIHE